MRKVCKGVSETFYEKAFMKALGIVRLKSER